MGLPAGTCLLSGDPVQVGLLIAHVPFLAQVHSEAASCRGECRFNLLQGRVALSFMLWAAVPWTGGRWAPQQEGQDADEAAAAAPAAQPLPEAAGNSTEGGDASLEGDLEELTALAEGLDAAIEGLSSLLEEPSSRRRLRRRALRQAPLGPEAAAPTSSAFLRGPDLAGSTTAASEDECAAACSRDERCTMWALCPPSEADG